MSTPLILLLALLALLAGIGLGAALWLVPKSVLEAEVKQCRESLSQTQREIGEVRGEGDRKDEELSRVRQEFGEMRARAERLPGLEEQLHNQGKLREVAETALASIQAASEAELRSMNEKITLLSAAETQFKDAFKVLSADALKVNRDELLKEAKDQLKTEVDPLSKSLMKVEDEVRKLETARLTAYSEIKNQLQSLGGAQTLLNQETSNLVKALRQPQVRGRWGELTLRNAVEAAGLSEFCDFEEQVNLETEEGRQRPDMVVRLPGGKKAVVDAKTPLTAFLDALEAPDEKVRAACMARHAGHVRTHLESLAKKDYSKLIGEAPDFTILFLPGESFFSAALEEDRELIQFGMNRGVILATPTTLLVALRSIAYAWKQSKLGESVEAIRSLGQDIYDRLRVMAEHMEAMGEGLEKAAKSYNRMVSTVESRVLVTARKFESLGIEPRVNAKGEAQRIVDLHSIETMPGALSAPELRVLPGSHSRDTSTSDERGVGAMETEEGLDSLPYKAEES